MDSCPHRTGQPQVHRCFSKRGRSPSFRESGRGPGASTYRTLGGRRTIRPMYTVQHRSQIREDSQQSSTGQNKKITASAALSMVRSGVSQLYAGVCRKLLPLTVKRASVNAVTQGNPIMMQLCVTYVGAIMHKLHWPTRVCEASRRLLPSIALGENTWAGKINALAGLWVEMDPLEAKSSFLAKQPVNRHVLNRVLPLLRIGGNCPALEPAAGSSSQATPESPVLNGSHWEAVSGRRVFLRSGVSSKLHHLATF